MPDAIAHFNSSIARSVLNADLTRYLFTSATALGLVEVKISLKDKNNKNKSATVLHGACKDDRWYFTVSRRRDK